MLLAFNLIKPIWAITGGSFVTSSDALHDREPANVARMTWPSGGQTTSTTCALTATFPEQEVRGLALLASTLPPGLKVEVRGKRPSDSGYTYNLGGISLTQKLVATPGGGVGAGWEFALANDALVGIEIKLYNDVGGSAALGASESFDIGEIAMGNGVAFGVETGWTMSTKMPGRPRRTLGSQIALVSRPGYRVLSVKPELATSGQAYASDLDSSNWQLVAAAIRADPYVLAISVAADPAHAQQTSLFGLATKLPDLESRAGPYYGPGELVIEEIPA